LFLHQYEENLVSDSLHMEGQGRGRSTTKTMDVGSEMGSLNYSR